MHTVPLVATAPSASYTHCFSSNTNTPLHYREVNNVKCINAFEQHNKSNLISKLYKMTRKCAMSHHKHSTTLQEKRCTVPLTCLQWFSKTMRQVSGSAVHGLEGAVLIPGRLTGPLGFNLLSQLILDPVRGK